MSVDLASVVIRALSFLMLFQAVGGCLFLLLLGAMLGRSSPEIRRLSVGCALTAMLLVGAHYGLEAGRLSGTWDGVLDPELQYLVWNSQARTVLLERLLGIALLGMVSGVGRRLSGWTTLAGVVSVAMSFAATGHIAESASTRWLRLVLAFHAAVAAFWFGALIPLLRVSLQEETHHAALIIERFSRYAVWLVPGLFAAGLLLAWSLVPSWSTFAEPYGLLLLGKLAGFMVLMMLAALNKWRYGPLLARDPSAMISFRRSVVAEGVIISGILVVTAVLTSFYSPSH